jgi:hypothetical protein
MHAERDHLVKVVFPALRRGVVRDVLAQPTRFVSGL